MYKVQSLHTGEIVSMAKHKLVKLESSQELEQVTQPDIIPCLWGLLMDVDFDDENIQAINTRQTLENIPPIQRSDNRPQCTATVASDRFLAIDDENVDQFNKENENETRLERHLCLS